jgi:hypothetical protein
LAWRRNNRWYIRYKRLPWGDQVWANNTSACESGKNPAANTGNGFYGAFQFMLSTWHMAGGTGSPHMKSWYEQAVVAVRWRNRAGAGQWPVCGH